MKTSSPPWLLDSLHITLSAGIQAEIARAIAQALRAVADSLDAAGAPKRRGRPPGRPRKAAEVAAIGEAPPKRRGRPPKNPPIAEEPVSHATPAKLRALRAARAALAEKRRRAAEEQGSPPVSA